MIKQFTRHILGEILKLFLISLVSITVVVMLFLVVQRALLEGLGISEIVQLLPYFMLASLEYALPATLLFAVCSVFGRMAADNEVVAIKSAGISPLSIVFPVLVLALFLSPIAVVLNDLAISWGKTGVNRVLMHSLEEIAYRGLRRSHVFTFNKNFKIKIKDVQDRWLIAPVITMYNDGPAPWVIAAERAKLALHPDQELLVIELQNYELNMGGNELRSGLALQIPLPLNQARRKNQSDDRPSQYPLLQIGKEAAKEREKSELNQQQLARHWAAGLALGRLDAFRDTSSNSHQAAIDNSQNRLLRLAIEPWRRWAIGFSCFFFVWLGAPLAIWMKNADYFSTFGMSFLPILAIYFPLFGLSLELSKDGQWPACSVWAGNLAIFAVGGYLLRKVYVG
jgi:lipopolysaccharide export system permease protein